MDDETIIKPSARVTRIPDRDDERTQYRRAAKPSGDDETQIPKPPPGLLGWLIVTNGMRRGHIQPIKDDDVIGRSPEKADIVFADDRLSGLHSRFKIEDGAFVVWDFGSTNGTFVNGKRIREATRLAENDRVQMGSTTFILKTLPADQDTPA